MAQGGLSKVAGTDTAKRAGRQAAAKGRQAGAKAEQLQQRRWYRLLVAVGLVCFGVVHLLIAWIALQVAWTGGGGQASSQGALQQVAKTPVGLPILIVIIIGMLPLAAWQLTEALVGYPELDDDKVWDKRNRRRAGSAGRVVVYLALAASAAKVAAGRSSSSSGQDETWTGRLLRLPLGQVLVMVVAACVLAVGVSLIVKGVRRKFTDDLAGGVSSVVLRLGQAGYAAKGVALVVVGGLFGWAAITADPKKAGGMDQALVTIRSSPFGSVLLTVVALGIACFGLFCFAWARNPRRD